MTRGTATLPIPAVACLILTGLFLVAIFSPPPAQPAAAVFAPD